MPDMVCVCMLECESSHSNLYGMIIGARVSTAVRVCQCNMLRQIIGFIHPIRAHLCAFGGSRADASLVCQSNTALEHGHEDAVSVQPCPTTATMPSGPSASASSSCPRKTS